MKSHQINSHMESEEKSNRNKRNLQSNKKNKQKHQDSNESNTKKNSERLAHKNNMEEQNSNIEIYNENSDNNSSQSQDKKPIYVMSLELEDGNTAKIKIYSDSNPEVLSKEFCEKNNLEPEAAEYLSSQIEALIAQFNNEEYSKISSSKNIPENLYIEYAIPSNPLFNEVHITLFAISGSLKKLDPLIK